MKHNDACKKAYEYLVSLPDQEFIRFSKNNQYVHVQDDIKKNYSRVGFDTPLAPPYTHCMSFSVVGAWAMAELKDQFERNKKLTDHVEILKEEIGRLHMLLNIRNGESKT